MNDNETISESKNKRLFSFYLEGVNSFKIYWETVEIRSAVTHVICLLRFDLSK
jgi:hypothetical protein